MHTLSYPFLQKYVRLSPSDMNDFSFCDLQTLYQPPYLSIMLRNSILLYLMRQKSEERKKYTTVLTVSRP